MTNRSRRIWMIFLAIICGLIPIGLSIYLSFNSVNIQKVKENSINEINNILGKKEEANNMRATSTYASSSLPYWTLQKVEYIKNNINWNQQSYINDLSNILKITNNINDSKQYIDNIISGTTLTIKPNEHYDDFLTITNTNLTANVNNIQQNYIHRYHFDAIDKSSDLVVNNARYANAISSNQIIPLDDNNQVFKFNLQSNTDNSKQDLQIIKQTINRSPSLFDIDLVPNNKFYKIYRSKYRQIINASSQQYEERNQLVVEWKNINDVNNNFIDVLTADFWINLLLDSGFVDISRIVVKPANLIIYRNSKNIRLNKIPFNLTTLKKLFINKTIVSIDDWMNTCINENPTNEFDARTSLGLKVHDCKSLNIPLIINVDDKQYENYHTYTSPTKIVNSLLFSYNNFNHDRSWGNIAFTNLNELIISMNSSNAFFNLTNANNPDVVSKYTNANPNTAASNEIVANQFYTMPSLNNFKTNDINIFFENFKAINNLFVLKKFNSDFATSSFEKYLNLSLNFLCELSNEYHFIIKDKINYDTFNQNVNDYFNYFNRSRDYNNKTYEYYDAIQNQWVANNFISNGNQYYRYEYLYGFYNYLAQIVFPFSLIKTIDDVNNPLYLSNSISESLKDQWITRYIDKMSNTIVYNSEMLSKNGLQISPQFLLTNNEFDLFIKKKLVENNNNHILDLTFDDWVLNNWTGISNDLDIFKVMDDNNVKFNTFTIPNIVIMNINTATILNETKVNKELVISLVLIIIISIFVVIELIIIILIIKSSNKNKWFYTTIQNKFNY